MKNSDFKQQALKISREALYYYFVWHDNEKLLRLFSRVNSNWIGWAFNEIYLGYPSVYSTFVSRIDEIPKVELSGLQAQIVYEAEDLCVVFLTCHLATPPETGYLIEADGMYTFVVAKEEGEAKIVHLHSAAGWTQMQESEHFAAVRGRQRYRAYEQSLRGSDFIASLPANTPNGLKCCRIENNYPAFYINEALYGMAGYESMTEMLNATSGALSKMVYAPDLPKVEQALLNHCDGSVYAVNYRLLRKGQEPLWVLERGRCCSAPSPEDPDSCFICSITPLLLDDSELNYGTLLDRSLTSDPALPLESFLQAALELAGKTADKLAAMQSILELSCSILHVSGAFISDTGSGQPQILCHYQRADEIPLPQPASALPLNTRFNKHKVCQCSNIELLPPEECRRLKSLGVHAYISKIIPHPGQEHCIMTFYQTGSSHVWTENEKELIHQTASIAALLLP